MTTSVEWPMVAAWQALDSMITSPDEQNALEEVLQDDEGAALIAYIFSSLGELPEDDDVLVALASTFFALLHTIVHQGLREWSSKGTPGAFHAQVRTMLKNYPSIEHSFTPDECSEFISAVARQRQFRICLLDQVCGLYFAAKLLEEELESFSVEELLSWSSLDADAAGGLNSYSSQ